MKKLLTLLAGLFAASNLSAINWIHTIYNGTDGTIFIRLDTSVGVKASGPIKPGQSKDFGVGLYCVTDVHVEGQADPVQGLRADYHIPASRNWCTGHQFNVLHKGWEKVLKPVGGTTVGTEVIIGGGPNELPDTSVSYQKLPYYKQGGFLKVSGEWDN